MEVSQVRKLRVLEEENGRVKRLLADAMLDNAVLKLDKTAEDLRDDGFFVTGDLGRIDERGYVWIVSRAKDLIMCGGYNVYPAEVEALLDAVPGIAKSAVIGVPYPDMGEGVVAVVQVNAPGLDEAAVIAALDGQVARFKQPRRVIFVPELPRNPMGKIEKKVLRETYADLFAECAGARP